MQLCNTEQGVLNAHCSALELNTVNGKPGKLQSKEQSGKMVISTTNLSLEGVLEMLISY